MSEETDTDKYLREAEECSRRAAERDQAWRRGCDEAVTLYFRPVVDQVREAMEKIIGPAVARAATAPLDTPHGRAFEVSATGKHGENAEIGLVFCPTSATNLSPQRSSTASEFREPFTITVGKSSFRRLRCVEPEFSGVLQ